MKFGIEVDNKTPANLIWNIFMLKIGNVTRAGKIEVFVTNFKFWECLPVDNVDQVGPKRRSRLVSLPVSYKGGLDPETGYSDGSFSLFFSVCPGKCRGSTLN
jgi:hypothetical protein